MKRLCSHLTVPFAMCAVLVMSGCAAGSKSPTPRTIAVEGRGVIRVAPDRFQLRARVEQRDKDLEKARAHVSDVTARIIEVVKTYPVDADRTHTTWFAVYPRYDRETDEFKNYEVSQSIDICLLDLSKSEQLTMDVLQAGATNVSIDFLAEQDKYTLMDRAKQAAVQDARQKAEMMASVLGNRVGQPLEVGRPDGGWGSDQNARFERIDDWDSGDTQSVTWLAPTQVEFEATVYVRFALIEAGEQ